MNRSILALAISTVVLLSSCSTDRVNPSGNIVSQEGPTGTYQSIDAGDAFEVFVTWSETEDKVEIRADDNLMQYIDVRGNGSSLDIGLRDVSIKSNPVLQVYISTTAMHSFSASGAVEMELTNTFPDVESIELSGASEFDGTLESNDLRVALSGASEVNLSGDVTALDLDLSGASEFEDISLTTESLDANLSGASEARVAVTGEIIVKASGASTLYYSGDPIITSQDLSGASELIKL